METVQGHIVENTKTGSQIHTDEFLAYSNLSKLFPHKIVNHGNQEYVNGDTHTNTIESFWALFKRGYHGVYHWMSRKHMQRYVNEYSFRWNHRENEMKNIFHDTVLGIVENTKLPYKELTA